MKNQNLSGMYTSLHRRIDTYVSRYQLEDAATQDFGCEYFCEYLYWRYGCYISKSSSVCTFL